MHTQSCPACREHAVLQPEGVCEICLMQRELFRGLDATALARRHALETCALENLHLAQWQQLRAAHEQQRLRLAQWQHLRAAQRTPKKGHGTRAL